MRARRRRWGSRTVAIALVPLAVTGIGARTAAIPVEPPMLPAATMAELGWSVVECGGDETGPNCIFIDGDGNHLALQLRPLGPGGDADTMLDAMAQVSCGGRAPIDVGDRADTVACTADDGAGGSQTFVVFANDAFQVDLIRLGSGPLTSDQAAALLDVRDRQLAAIGGERTASDPPTAEGAHLDRFLPTDAPADLSPPGGVTVDLDVLGGIVPTETLNAEGLDYLRRRSASRARVWTRDDGFSVAVVVAEHTHELIAGLFLGALERPPYTALATPAAGALEDLVSVDGTVQSVDGSAMVIEAFRRGRYEFEIIATGPDVAGAAELSSLFVPLVAAAAPTDGPTAPIQPPSALVSILRAVVIAAALLTAVMIVRRLIAGRARRAAALKPPAPAVTDVSHEAAALRRNGRILAGSQVLACAVVVVGLVADVGWWWPVLVTAGLAVGVVATVLARRREQGHGVRTWSLDSGPAWVFGSIGAVLLVVGAGVAVRALTMTVFLPSIADLRLAERFRTTPERVALVMGAAGLALLVLGAVLLRRGRAFARSARGRAAAGHGHDILYLRSFEDDHLTVPSVHSARRPFFELFGIRGRDPFEEGVAWELAAYGTLTAIGLPGGSTVSLGAARDHVADDEWQGAVAARMDASRYVVVSIGTTQGLAWELRTLISRGHLGKCVFVVPPVDATEVATRWVATRAVIDAACGRSFVEPVALVGTLTARIDPASGRVSAMRADRLDEAGYRAAIERSLTTLIWSPPIVSPGWAPPPAVAPSA